MIPCSLYEAGPLRSFWLDVDALVRIRHAPCPMSCCRHSAWTMTREWPLWLALSDKLRNWLLATKVRRIYRGLFSHTDSSLSDGPVAKPTRAFLCGLSSKILHHTTTPPHPESHCPIRNKILLGKPVGQVSHNCTTTPRTDEYGKSLGRSLLPIITVLPIMHPSRISAGHT